jgi:hypothetical protein
MLYNVDYTILRMNIMTDRQCTCDVTSSGVRATVVAVEKQWISRMLSYPACRSPACYFDMCRAWFDYIFQHYHINGIIFRKSYPTFMCVLIFSTTFVWNNSHSKNSSAGYYHKYTQVFTQSNRYFCQILINLELFLHIFEKYSNVNFLKFFQWDPTFFKWKHGQT